MAFGARPASRMYYRKNRRERRSKHVMVTDGICYHKKAGGTKHFGMSVLYSRRGTVLVRKNETGWRHQEKRFLFTRSSPVRQVATRQSPSTMPAFTITCHVPLDS